MIVGTADETVGTANATRTALLTAAVIFFNAAGNLLLAWGMKQIGELSALHPLGYVRALLNPFVAVGVSLLILWLLTRMALLSWADLSFVLPVTAVGYVLAALLGHFLLGEAVSYAQWLGTLLIFTGTLLVGTTKQKTAGAV